MNNQNKQNLQELSKEQLIERSEALRRDLFSLRLSAKTSHVKDVSQFKKMRKDIARALTVLQEKKMQAYQEAFFEAFANALKEMQSQNDASVAE